MAMTRDDRGEIVNNRSCQEQLARSLLDSLGREGAIHACQANNWDGVLGLLLTSTNRPLPPLRRA
jgi:hypothetical protein